MDSCYVRVPSISRNSSVTIDHESYPYYPKSIQIIAQLIPKERCQHCFLYTELWENLDLEKTYRYTRWSNITEVRWFCITPYAFRLQANIMRSPQCSIKCYLLLKFNHFKAMHVTSFQHHFYQYYTKQRVAEYMSWYEARQRCLKLGATLPKLTRDTSHMWINMAPVIINQRKLNPFHETSFMDLHKESEVRS